MEHQQRHCCAECATYFSHTPYRWTGAVYCGEGCAIAHNDLGKCAKCSTVVYSDELHERNGQRQCTVCASTCDRCGRADREHPDPSKLHRTDEDELICWCCRLQDELAAARNRHPFDPNIRAAAGIASDVAIPLPKAS